MKIKWPFYRAIFMFGQSNVLGFYKIPIISKTSATGTANKINTRQAIIILRNPLSIFTPKVSSCSISVRFL
ncbi:hypothetical protein [Zobellia russellii]|uniref:hypothetical protein n=1 Tax=Zobellia russellii TaxID=248907 RepID=UPI0037DDCECF